ncbi:MAG: hypothetical protein AB7P08_10395 [Burkholderiales bacterium]
MNDALATNLPNAAKLKSLQAASAECARRLAAAQTDAANLEEERRRALVAGDDKALELLDTRLDATRKAVARDEDRSSAFEVEIQRVTEAAARDQLMELVGKARAARAVGEKLILDAYPKAAKKVAEILANLAAIDAFIQHANERAVTAGLDATPTPPLNYVRRRASQTIPAHTVTREVVDLSRQPLRVMDGASILSTMPAPTIAVSEDLPAQVISFRPPDKALEEECRLAPARDGEPAHWERNCPSHRDAILRAESIVDQLLK